MPTKSNIYYCKKKKKANLAIRFFDVHTALDCATVLGASSFRNEPKSLKAKPRTSDCSMESAAAPQTPSCPWSEQETFAAFRLWEDHLEDPLRAKVFQVWM